VDIHPDILQSTSIVSLHVESHVAMRVRHYVLLGFFRQ